MQQLNNTSLHIYVTQCMYLDERDAFIDDMITWQGPSECYIIQNIILFSILYSHSIGKICSGYISSNIKILYECVYVIVVLFMKTICNTHDQGSLSAILEASHDIKASFSLFFFPWTLRAERFFFKESFVWLIYIALNIVFSCCEM